MDFGFGFPVGREVELDAAGALDGDDMAVGERKLGGRFYIGERDLAGVRGR